MDNEIPSQLSDSDLIAEVARLAISERRTTASLIAHLAELDARRLYLGAGFSSTFTYCTEVLRLSEGGAYNRIEAARAARTFPMVLELLDQGALNLTSVRILAPHLTHENHRGLLAAAAHKSRRQVEELVARWFSKPDVESSVRKLPGTRPQASSPTLPLASAPTAVLHGAPAVLMDAGPCPTQHTSALRALPPPRHPLITPLSPDRYQVRFTATARTCEKLKLAQDLLRHAVPSGDPAEIFDRALTALLEDLARKKFAAAKRPRGRRGRSSLSRSIPAHVKRAVLARDHGHCAFGGGNAHRCAERAFLEFHHVVPYAMGGPATTENIQLRCRAHNGYEADMCFGPSSRLVPGRVEQLGVRGTTVLSGQRMKG